MKRRYKMPPMPARKDLETMSDTTADTQPALPIYEPATTMQYWVDRRAAMELEIKAIEDFIGFVETSEAMAVRIAKIEQFLGLK